MVANPEEQKMGMVDNQVVGQSGDVSESVVEWDGSRPWLEEENSGPSL